MYRLAHYLLPTTKEDPAGAEIPSHKLMLRAGMIRQLMAGVHSHLPLLWRAIRKAQEIVREEQERIGAQELLMAALSPADLWQESGRWATFGDDMFRLKDRKQSDAALAPTHEEIITEHARAFIHSYRQLPQMWFQIQGKFRDEPRPRSGVLRGRQFIMKDAYSLDVDTAGLDVSYANQREAYQRTFRRCGIDFVIVGASSGLMGGSGSEEFMVLTPSGEDTIAVCPNCGYAANVEVAAGHLPPAKTTPPPAGALPAMTPVETPGQKSIDDVASFLQVTPAQTLKSMLYMTQEATPRAVMVVVRGDHEVNVDRLTKVLGGVGVRPAHDAEVQQVTGSPAGFISPVGLATAVTILLDQDILPEGVYVAGANRAEHHCTGVVPARDFPAFTREHLRLVAEGDLCVTCGGTLTVSRAIELGHIFKLGLRYSTTMGAMFLDAEGKQQPIVMGSYGIGMERIVACAIEQHHDDQGICFPLPIAPFHVVILALDPGDEAVMEAATTLGGSLEAAGWDVVLDDREERPGVKFADADLIGLPFQVIIGRKGLGAGTLEIKRRRDGERVNVPVAEVSSRLQTLLQEEAARYALPT